MMNPRLPSTTSSYNIFTTTVICVNKVGTMFFNLYYLVEAISKKSCRWLLVARVERRRV